MSAGIGALAGTCIVSSSNWVAATSDHDQVLALLVIDPRLWDQAMPHGRAHLAANLQALDQQLAEMGGRLKVVTGDPAELIPAAADTYQAVYWNEDVSALLDAQTNRFGEAPPPRPLPSTVWYTRRVRSSPPRATPTASSLPSGGE